MTDHRPVPVAGDAPTPEPASVPTGPDRRSTTPMSPAPPERRGLVARRRGRYVAGSAAHPARMAPDLAADLIADYSDVGDWVCDPFAGTGTVLAEAVRAGRHAVGVEIEAGWVALARANLALARHQGGSGCGRVVRADATRLPHHVPGWLRGQVALVLTAPPHTATMPGHLPGRQQPTRTRRGRVGRHPAQRRIPVQAGLTAALAGCLPLLRPGGIVAVVSRVRCGDPVRADLPRQAINAGLRAGLHFVAYRRAVTASATRGHDDIAVFRRASDGHSGRTS